MSAKSLVAEVSLDRVKRRLIVGSGMVPHEAENAVALYRNFLELVYLYPAESICPPTAADDAWHLHMEEEQYSEDCIALFGREIVHNRDAFGTEEFRQAWAVTRRLWLRHFGVVLDVDPDLPRVSALAPMTCLVEVRLAA